MTGFILDTNVISLFSPSNAGAFPAFAQWIQGQEALEANFLSVVTVHEIEKGVRMLEAKGATAKARLIDFFLQGLVAGYGNRILPVDARIARQSGMLEALALAGGHNPGMADSIIAGTARVHGFSVVTRNVKHFQPFGVSILSPDDIV